MSYLKYTTPAFVVSLASRGEADRMAKLYTRDFGMISAIAKSVRLVKSKLKSALEEGNFLSVSLVRGKEIWRLTDAEAMEKIDPQSEEFKLFLKIIKLKKGLIQGEEKNEELFAFIEQVHGMLFNKKFGDALLESFECLTVLRILDLLGYGREHETLGFSISDSITPPLLLKVEKNKERVISLINKSIKESHL